MAKQAKPILLFCFFSVIGSAWLGYSHFWESSLNRDGADEHESEDQHAIGGTQTDGSKLSTSYANRPPRLPKRNYVSTKEIESNDAASLRARFEESKNCYELHITLSIAENSLLECEVPAGTPGYRDCSGDLGLLEEQVRDLRSRSANCATEAPELARAYYDGTKAAARAGDIDAQMCYMQSSYAAEFHNSHPVFPYTEQDKLDYLGSVPLYVEDALARGDWRIVELVAFAARDRLGLMYLIDWRSFEFFSAQTDGPLDHVADHWPTIYEMNRLLRLGATGEYAKELDLTADDLENGERMDGSGRGVISADQENEARAWAQRMYDQYFSKSLQLTEAPWPCKAESQR